MSRHFLRSQNDNTTEGSPKGRRVVRDVHLFENGLETFEKSDSRIGRVFGQRNSAARPAELFEPSLKNEKRVFLVSFFCSGGCGDIRRFFA
jgi:hypothetical protein